jgi:hypothetical protein
MKSHRDTPEFRAWEHRVMWGVSLAGVAIMIIIAIVAARFGRAIDDNLAAHVSVDEVGK